MKTSLHTRMIGRGGAITDHASQGLQSCGHQVTVAVLYGGSDFEVELVKAGSQYN